MPGRPPRAERVLEQEPDHVVLGEQLGHRPEVGAADLALRGVDLVLLVLLPELVHPAERVVGGERPRPAGRRGSARARAGPPARAAAARTDRRAGRCPGRISAANRAATDQPSGSPSSPASSSQSASVTGASILRVQQQVVLRQEPGEQQPVPLLVGALGDEQLPVAAELAPLRPQTVAQRRLLGVEMLGPAVGEHAQARRAPHARRSPPRAGRPAPPSRAACGAADGQGAHRSDLR